MTSLAYWHYWVGKTISGTELCHGRPKNDPDLVAEARRPFADDQRQCNAAEGKIGQGKQRFGLGLIREKLVTNQGSAIIMNFMAINLEKLQQLLLVLIAFLLQLLSSQAGVLKDHKLPLNTQGATARGSLSKETACMMSAIEVTIPTKTTASMNSAGSRLSC